MTTQNTSLHNLQKAFPTGAFNAIVDSVKKKFPQQKIDSRIYDLVVKGDKWSEQQKTTVLPQLKKRPIHKTLLARIEATLFAPSIYKSVEDQFTPLKEHPLFSGVTIKKVSLEKIVDFEIPLFCKQFKLEVLASLIRKQIFDPIEQDITNKTGQLSEIIQSAQTTLLEKFSIECGNKFSSKSLSFEDSAGLEGTLDGLGKEIHVLPSGHPLKQQVDSLPSTISLKDGLGLLDPFSKVFIKEPSTETNPVHNHMNENQKTAYTSLKKLCPTGVFDAIVSFLQKKYQQVDPDFYIFLVNGHKQSKKDQENNISKFKKTPIHQKFMSAITFLFIFNKRIQSIQNQPSMPTSYFNLFLASLKPEDVMPFIEKIAKLFSFEQNQIMLKLNFDEKQKGFVEIVTKISSKTAIFISENMVDQSQIQQIMDSPLLSLQTAPGD